MVNYIAFLRGINVGGQKVIKMDDLTRIFKSLGFADVKTYIQSGNIVFNSNESNSDLLSEVTEEYLFKKLGYRVTVLLRTKDEIEILIKQNPFEEFNDLKNVKFYVSFLRNAPLKLHDLPLISPNKDIEIFKIKNLEAYIISRYIKGRFGFPNHYIEKEFGVLATTRNWTTVINLFR